MFGFKLEGAQREKDYIDGNYTDRFILGLLRKDWKSLKNETKIQEKNCKQINSDGKNMSQSVIFGKKTTMGNKIFFSYKNTQGARFPAKKYVFFALY